jgi:hypothetical protein
MHAHRYDDRGGIRPEEPLPSWPLEGFDAVPLESSTRLASERPTVPPPRMAALRASAGDDVMVSHIHLGPGVDEILYRLTLGDLAGAELASAELDPYIPVLRAAPIVVEAMELGYLDEYMLASVDGASTWGELLDSSPFARRETLKALCDLVDKGAVALTR